MTGFGIDLLNKPPPMPSNSRWVRWPDFLLPADRGDSLEEPCEAERRAATERVEVACGGGRGRTGTAIACNAALEGMTACEALAYVRKHYDRRAVETPRQRRYVEHFPAP